MSEWEEVPGFPLYVINRDGQVRRRDREYPVMVHQNQQEVAYVSLMTEAEQFHRGLARLVLKTFVPQKLDAFDTPINLDGDRMNCCVDNLMWRPRWFAIQYHLQFKHRFEDPIEQPIIDVDSGRHFQSSWDACTKLGLLEKDLVASIDNFTVVWPTYQRFQVID